MALDFIPFGAQYYRAPTPKPECWEEDLRRFAEHGFNTIKIWAQWRWNNPQKDVYDFSDLRQIMDIAYSNGLKVVINVIMDVMPVWFFRDNPDSAMITCNGERIIPQTTPYRQIGGAPGPCYNHPTAQEYKDKFVLALAEEFADHPALLLWDLWNEPELTCGIKRAPDMPSMVCYCEHCEKAFIEWLKEKYGTLDALNTAWQKNYCCFEEVELPRSPGVFQDMVDWREYYTYVLRDDLRSRANCVKTFDKEHPVMIHTVPSPYFNMINSCCDDYLMAKECDLFGNSIGSDPFPAVLSVCSAKGKTVLNAEIHAMGGSTFDRPGELSYNQLKRHIFTPFSVGIKGFLFWQYKPETLGLESPAWGMVDLEGNETACTQHSKRINQLFAKEQELMWKAAPAQSKIAIIKDNNNEVFDWCVEQTVRRAHSSVTGAFNAFYHAGYRVDIISADQLVEEDISDYQLIYYPFPYYIKKPVADRLKGWVENGGTFVSEGLFGSYRAEDGLHSIVSPGYGYDEVFSAKETTVRCASQFHDAYSEKWSSSDVDRERTAMTVTLHGEELEVGGYFFEQCFDVKQGGSAIAKYENGKTAAVQSCYGKGRTFIFGSLLGYSYSNCSEYQPAMRRLAELLANAAGVQKDVISSTEAVHCSVLTAELDTGKRGVMILDNSDARKVSIKLADHYNFTKAADTDSDIVYDISNNELSVDIASGEIKVLLLY